MSDYKSVSFIVYAVEPSQYTDLTLVPKSYVDRRLLDVTTSVSVKENGGLINTEGLGLSVAVDNSTIKINPDNGKLYVNAKDTGGTAGAVVKTDNTGKIAYSLLPDTKINNVFTASGTGTTGEGLYSSDNTSYADITPDVGDICIVTSNGTITSYILTATPHTTAGNWVQLNTPSNSVVSITAGSDTLTGAITLSGATASGSTISIQEANAVATKSTSGIKKGVAAFNSYHFGADTGFISLKTLTAATSNGLAITANSISMAKASDSAFGTVKLDNKTITTTGTAGVIQVNLKEKGGLAYDSTTNATGVKVVVDDSTIKLNTDGKLYVAGSYASSTALTNLTTRVSTLEGYKHITAAGTENYVLTADSNGDPQWSETIARTALPKATTGALGAVYVDDSTIGVESDGKIKVKASYLTTTAASTTYQTKISTSGATSGQVLSYNGSGFAWVNQTTAYSLTAAGTSASALGGVYVDNSTITVDEDGKISVKSGVYATASHGTHVPTGTNVTTANAVLTASNTSGTPQWSTTLNTSVIPAATTSAKGGVFAPVTGGLTVDTSTGSLTVNVDGSTITKDGTNGTLSVGSLSAGKITSGTLGRSILPTANGTGSMANNGGGIYLANNTTSCLTVSSGALSVNRCTDINTDKSLDYKVPTPKAVANYVLTTTHGFPAFQTTAGTTYNVDDLVVYNGTLYRCTETTTSGTWQSGKWVATNVPAVSRFTDQLTVAASSGSTDTQVAITHNLGTKDLVVQVYAVNSLSNENSRKPVLVDYEFTSNNVITLLFASPRENASYYRVVILAAR